MQAKVFKKSNKKKLIMILVIILFLAILIIPIEKYQFLLKVQKIFSSDESIEDDGITFSYEILKTTLDEESKYNYNLLVTVECENGLASITYPGKAQEITLNCDNKNKVEIDFLATYETEYEFNIKTSDNKEKTEIIKESTEIGNGEYIQDGLIVHYDGINNTGLGHSKTASSWKNLAGNSYDAVLIGCTWGENYLYTDGVNDWAYVLGTHMYPNVTIEVVIKRDILTGRTANLNCWQGAGVGFTADDPGSGLSSGGCTSFQIYAGGYKMVKSTQKIVKNKIYSISGSYNGDTMKLFENGTEYSNYIGKKSISYLSNTPYTIGANAYSKDQPQFGWPERSYYYSIRIYNRALSESEVAHNYEIDKARFNFND